MNIHNWQKHVHLVFQTVLAPRPSNQIGGIDEWRVRNDVEKLYGRSCKSGDETSVVSNRLSPNSLYWSANSNLSGLRLLWYIDKPIPGTYQRRVCPAMSMLSGCCCWRQDTRPRIQCYQRTHSQSLKHGIKKANLWVHPCRNAVL